MSSGIDAPAAREGLIRLEPDQPLAAAKRVRWTRHRLDGDAVPVHVRKRIAREHHHVRVLLIDPERELAAPVGVSQLDASSAVVVAPQLGEGMVKDGRADRPRLAEVVVRPLHRRASNRDAALVGDQHLGAGHTQRQRIHTVLAEREVGMVAAPVGARTRPAIGGGRPDEQAIVREQVFDAEGQRERVARLRMQRVLHHDPVLRAVAGGPRPPADEAVDRVLLHDVVEGKLVLLAVEAVEAVLNPVRPRDQNLPAA